MPAPACTYCADWPVTVCCGLALCPSCAVEHGGEEHAHEQQEPEAELEPVEVDRGAEEWRSRLLGERWRLAVLMADRGVESYTLG